MGSATNSYGDVRVDNSTFEGNDIGLGGGGAILSGANGSTISSTFTATIAVGDGGAVLASGDVDVSDSVFLSNRTSDDLGGAIGAGGNVNVNGSTKAVCNGHRVLVATSGRSRWRWPGLNLHLQSPTSGGSNRPSPVQRRGPRCREPAASLGHRRPLASRRAHRPHPCPTPAGRQRRRWPCPALISLGGVLVTWVAEADRGRGGWKA